MIRHVTYLLCLLAFLSFALQAQAITTLDLYCLDIGGQIQRIDPATGAKLGMFSLPSNRQWNSIAATPFDPTGIYAASLEVGSAGRKFSRIDAKSGALLDIAMTNASGSVNPLSYGPWAITFDPAAPHSGYMATTASTSQGVQLNRLARFNLVTREFETSLVTTHRWTALAMNSQGELIGSVDFFDDSHASQTTEIYNIDPDTGLSTLRFTVASRDVTGLAYHPEDGRLFAIDGVSNDDLVLLDRDSGAIERVGDLPSGGPNGIAFTSIAGLLGDYNRDGVVDAADYTTWRDTFGQNVNVGSGADGSLNGIVDSDDYATWKSHFGEQAGEEKSDGFASVSTIPEPASQVILAAAWLVLVGFQVARRFRRTDLTWATTSLTTPR